MCVACALIPVRAVVASMIFAACFITYVLKANMSINIIAMTKPLNNTVHNLKNIPECLNFDPISRAEWLNQDKNKTVPDYGPRYEWDSPTQGIILGSYFWGYMITSIPGGLLAELFGALQIIGISTIVCALLNIAIPFLAPLHYGGVIAVRFVTGFIAGVIYPALQCLISKWAPPAEKGKFIGALLAGGTTSTAITWPLLGLIAQGIGWPWAFYLPSAVVLLWCVSWFALITNSPQNHRRITEKERTYIITSFGDTITKTKKIPPYKQIFLSIPFWAYTILQFGNLWCLYLLLTVGPKYMTEVLGFNLSKSGLLASLPYVARSISAIVFGVLGDFCRKKERFSVTVVRKFFVIFSHIIPGLLLALEPLSGCRPIPAVFFLTMTLGLNGATAVTSLINAQDLAPNFAGTIFGIANCIGGVTGFITPMLTGYITRKKSGLKEWRLIFLISAAVYISSGVIFIVFGSANVQSWNHVEEDAQKGTNDNPTGSKQK